MTALTQAWPRRTVRGASATHWLLIATVVGVSTALLVAGSGLGDYGFDAGPAMNALVGGHVGLALGLQPLMGSLSLLVRAPFALLAAGHGEMAVYRAGIVPCALAAAACGVAIARRAGVLGSTWALPIVLLAVLTPASVSAVRLGHPEEALAAALVVAAVLLAERDALWAGIALGLALATKQWAVVAIPPVLWLVPAERRLRSGLVATGVAALLTVPLLVGSASAFARTSHNAATSPTSTTRANIWYLVAHHTPNPVPGAAPLADLPAWLAQLTHPLIVLVGPLLALAVWRRRPTTADALALLALALLLRCVLDPVDNEYYHLPFLLALLAYETIGRRGLYRLPFATLFACAGLSITFDFLDDRLFVPATLTSLVYLAWTGAIAVYLVHALRRRSGA